MYISLTTYSVYEYSKDTVIYFLLDELGNARSHPHPRSNAGERCVSVKGENKELAAAGEKDQLAEM